MQTLVHHFLMESTQASPQSPAVHDRGAWMTYGELDSASNRLGDVLAREGVARGDRVALLLENSSQFVTAYEGILKCGAVVVALNTKTTADLLVRLLEHSGASAIISSGKYLRHLIPALTLSPGVRLLVADVPPVAGVTQRFRTFASCLADGEDRPPRCATIDVDCASIVYTSGSTGDPKGVMLSHLNIVANTRSICAYLRLTSADRVMDVLPLYYVYGTTLLNTHLAVGGSLVIDNRFLFPNVVLEAMRDLEVTGFAGVPSTFMILLSSSIVRELRFPHLRYVTQAGGGMAPNVQKDVARVFAPAKVFIMYGATEFAPRLTYVPPDRLAEKWGSIGIAIPNTEAFVADEQGQRLPQGVEGEIAGRGSNVMMGYWRNPEATARVLREGVYFTGDRGIMDAEGFLFVVGRSSDMVKVGGNRVSAKEIEEALLALDGIREAAVVAVPDPVLGEAARAFVVPTGTRQLSQESVRAALAGTLAPYKIPKFVTLTNALPKNESGKIMKKMLIT